MDEGKPDTNPPEDPSPGWQSYVGLGVELTAPIVVGVFGGYYADAHFGTKPALVLTGALLGMAAGFYEFFKRVFRWNKPPK